MKVLGWYIGPNGIKNKANASSYISPEKCENRLGSPEK
jgi:hypothetical protein